MMWLRARSGGAHYLSLLRVILSGNDLKLPVSRPSIQITMTLAPQVQSRVTLGYSPLNSTHASPCVRTQRRDGAPLGCNLDSKGQEVP